MAKNDDLILRGKALKDLRGIKDMLMAAGDPFLAGVMNRAIECIEKQPSQGSHPIDAMLIAAAKYRAALKDLADIADCDYCKHDQKNKPQTESMPTCLADCEECADTCPCYKCEDGSMWEWRGAFDV